MSFFNLYIEIQMSLISKFSFEKRNLFSLITAYVSHYHCQKILSWMLLIVGVVGVFLLSCNEVEESSGWILLLTVLWYVRSFSYAREHFAQNHFLFSWKNFSYLSTKPNATKGWLWFESESVGWKWLYRQITS